MATSTRVLEPKDAIGKVHISEALVLPNRRKMGARGNRLATVKEIALCYRHDPEFRAALSANGFVWTAEDGLTTRGFYIITEEGDFRRIPESKISKFVNEQEKLSLHWPGPYQVSADVDNLGHHGLVLSAASPLSAHKARVAYVKEKVNGNGSERLDEGVLGVKRQ